MLSPILTITVLKRMRHFTSNNRQKRPTKELEKSLEAKITSYAKKQGALAYKFTSPAHRGVPDRLFIYRGKVLFLEIKAKGKKPTELQKHELEKLVEAGVAATWVDNLEDAKQEIDSLIML